VNKKVYIDSQVWLKNEYLVIPPGTKQSVSGSAHKKCCCCEKVKFTTEFPDYDDFEDEKLPVCVTCFKMQNEKGRNIVRLTGITVMCADCSMFKTLDEYSYTKRGNTLKTVCRTCGRDNFKEALSDDK